MSDQSVHLDGPNDDSEGKSKNAYVDEIMEQEADTSEASEVPVQRRSPVPIFTALLVVLIGLLAWNLVRIIHSPPVFTAEEEEAGALFSVYLVAQGLEAHLEAEGILPNDLEAAGVDGEEVTYGRANDSTYVLSVTVGEAELVYRRGDDLSRFATAYDVLSGETER